MMMYNNNNYEVFSFQVTSPCFVTEFIVRNDTCVRFAFTYSFIQDKHSVYIYLLSAWE